MKRKIATALRSDISPSRVRNGWRGPPDDRAAATTDFFAGVRVLRFLDATALGGRGALLRDVRYSARVGVEHKPRAEDAARGRPGTRAPPPPKLATRERYLMCLLTSFVISNIETCFLPPNTLRSLSSALM